MSSDLVQALKAKFKQGSSQYKVFELLSDRAWHCRTCEGKKIASEQYAGGGGIQVLERGNRSGRQGLVITPVRVKQRGVKPIPSSRRVFSAGDSKQSNHRED